VETINYQRDADGFLPIEAYGAIGNGRTVALVGSDASIDWCPFPRIDSPSVFARILDVDHGGYWQIRPSGDYTVSRRYLEDTNILLTRFETDDGTAEVVDFMPTLGMGTDLGISDRIHDGMIVRIVRGLRGAAPMRMELFPAFNYGRDGNEFELVNGRGALICGPSEYLSVLCEVELSIESAGLISEFTVEAEEECHFVVTHHAHPAPIWIDLVPGMVDRLFGGQLLGWRTWIGRCTYDGPYAETVKRSALTLKTLDYLPTGAFVAAATTSLPEDIGGVRNWDYRYSWIRDTTYVLYSLIAIGYREEAESFFQWVIDASDMDASDLRIMYQVDGEHDLHEFELDHMTGYKNSRPVNIGNKAFEQTQLDVWGEVLDAAHTYRRFNGFISKALWSYLMELAEQVSERWREPDAGIWEIRSEPRRMTYSNVMCWVALDRAIHLADIDNRDAPVDKWKATRDEIYDEVMSKGVHPERGVFTESFGGEELDASALSFPLRHFLDADHPIMKATIEAIGEELKDNGLVARYRVGEEGENLDGLPGKEGKFVITTFWYIDCLIGLGKFDEARDALEKMIERSNDLGLLSEQIDHETGEFLGNFPQAFSHLALINTIINYARATGQMTGPETTDTGELAAGEINLSFTGIS
jgi:GH15 family glucan-1,4-alpha-glucosidase